MHILYNDERLPANLKAFIRGFNASKTVDDQQEVLKSFAGQKWLVEVPITAADICDACDYSKVKLDTSLGEVWVTFLERYPLTGTGRIMRVPSIEEFVRFGTPLIADKA